MSKIVSVHSFRGGTGKSNTTANLAALMAVEGNRVGVIDTDIQSPGIHVLFVHPYHSSVYCMLRIVYQRSRALSNGCPSVLHAT